MFTWLLVGVVLIVVALGAYGLYLLYASWSNPNWCEMNRPDIEKMEDNGEDSMFVSYLGLCLSDSAKGQCQGNVDEYIESTEQLDFDGKSSSEIHGLCNALCVKFNEVVDCVCSSCDKCHSACGDSYIMRCQKNLYCGTEEVPVYVAGK